MGYSHMDFVRVVNRTTEPLDVFFDGMPRTLPPGYRIEEGKPVPSGEHGEVAWTMLPAPFAEFAKRQNPQMGTFDPESSNVFEPKVGVLDWNDDISFLAPTTATEVLDRELIGGDEAEVLVTTAGRRTRRSRAAVVDTKLKAPTGLKTDYND